jgi:hypothetical protein
MVVHPADPPVAAHAAQVALLEKHVAYFESVGDRKRSAEYAAEMRNTEARLVHDLRATEFVDMLGLTNEITPTTVTRNDAVNFVAKVLHEVEQGVNASHYVRAHYRLPLDRLDVHVDEKRMKQPWDPAADVVEHLGLTDPKHVAAATALFAKGA